MRFAVEQWSPDYGAPSGDVASGEGQDESVTPVDAWVEAGPQEWGPIRSPHGTQSIEEVAFVDGVQRVDANVWISLDDGLSSLAMCASYAAGVVVCAGDFARVVHTQVGRGLFTTQAGAMAIDTRHGSYRVHATPASGSDELALLLHARRGELETEVAARVSTEVVVVDGPLKVGQHRAGFVGYVKTHRRAYGPEVVRQTLSSLAVGERTPVLLIGGFRHRYSWYLRLPCAARHGWDGMVRLEAPADQQADDVIALADRLSVTLPRFASHPAKDPRAPQNLVPIGGLERDLRHRLGDPMLLYRSLQLAAHTVAVAAVSGA